MLAPCDVMCDACDVMCDACDVLCDACDVMCDACNVMCDACDVMCFVMVHVMSCDGRSVTYSLHDEVPAADRRNLPGSISALTALTKL